MPELDMTFLLDLDPRELSGSIAERGENAGPETWANAVQAAPGLKLDASGAEDVRKWAAGFGAWEEEEIAAWSTDECAALVLQYCAGDLRELQALAPGEGPGGVNWGKAEELAQEGTISNTLYASGERLFAWID